TDAVSYLELYVNKDGKWIHAGDDQKLKKINDSIYLVFGKVTSPVDTIYRVVRKNHSGYTIKDYQNKVLVSTGFSKMIIPLVKEGTWVNYYRSTHNIKSEEYYTNNQLTGNKRWKENATEDLANVFPHAEVDPEFKGGHKQLQTYLSTSTKYPGKSRRHNEKGIVMVQFIVMENGIIDGVEILKGVSPSLDAESLRVVKLMPTWKPGTINGKNVRVAMQVPFQYNIPKS
ncbi:MAG: energy transducer TonB, partial [Bacteroidota bacterium]|nr:energy transducer TonB [Bacteroidota bacterium]